MSLSADIQSPYFTQLVGADYQFIVRSAIDQAKEAPSSTDIPWIVGAMTFLGRTQEALGLFERYANAMDHGSRVAGQFFLSVALCREGDFEASRRGLIRNLKEASRDNDPIASFFAYQGLAFYRYSTGYLSRARRAADCALKEASGASFAYGSVLALELLGHVQLSSGQFHAGFRSFALAKEKAYFLGQGALLQAIEVSSILYQATFGLAKESQSLISLLQASISAERFEDSYTQAALNIEYARLLILRGELFAAKEQLETSSNLVYKIDNPDLEMDYNLLLASLLRNQGERLQALSIVRGVKHRVKSSQDIRSQLKVLGLESQILKAMGRLPEYEANLDLIRDLSHQCGSLMSQRHLARHQIESAVSIRPGEDVLGDLIDRVRYFEDGVVADILRTGWYGLLLKPLHIQVHEKVLHFDAEPGCLTVFNQGDVQHIAEGCSTLIRALLVLLSKAPASKEVLANQLWKQSYNPLRHDGLIYSLVAKARKLLGRSGEWIEAYELGYRLRDGVRVSTSQSADDPSSTSRDTEDHSRSDLNPRQKSIIDALVKGETLEPGELQKTLGVSDATISRDMAHLIELGWARRQGKGRATRYYLEPNKSIGVQ